MEVERVIELLKQTTDNDSGIREAAECELGRIHKTINGVRKIAEDKKLGLNIRVAAYNCLKNRIYEYPVPKDEPPGFTIKLPESPSFIKSPNARDYRVAELNDDAALVKTGRSEALNVWNNIEEQIPSLNESYVPITNLDDWYNDTIAIIRDSEPKAHEYGLTISFINMLNNLLISRHSELQSPQIQHSVILDTCLKLVTNLVFLKVDSRQFDKTEEKWTILNLCIQTYYLILSGYKPAEDGNAKSSFKLMSQILQDGELFNCIFMNLENAIDQLTSDLISYSESTIVEDEERVYKPNDLLDEHISLVLVLLDCVAKKQDDFLELIKGIPDHPTASTIKLDSLLNVANPQTGSVDRLATLMRILALTSDDTALQALNFMNNIKGDPEVRIAKLGYISRNLDLKSRAGRLQISNCVRPEYLLEDLGPKGMKRIKTEDGNMVFGINMLHFKPDEINVNVCNDDLIVEAKNKSSENDFHHEAEFKRRIRLPSDVNHEAIKSTFTPDLKLIVQMPMNKPQFRTREIPIDIQKQAIEDKEQQPDQEQQQPTQNES